MNDILPQAQRSKVRRFLKPLKPYFLICEAQRNFRKELFDLLDGQQKFRNCETEF